MISIFRQAMTKKTISTSLSLVMIGLLFCQISCLSAADIQILNKSQKPETGQCGKCHSDQSQDSKKSETRTSCCCEVDLYLETHKFAADQVNTSKIYHEPAAYQRTTGTVPELITACPPGLLRQLRNFYSNVPSHLRAGAHLPHAPPAFSCSSRIG